MSEIRIVKKNSIIILSPTDRGIIIEMANQKGTQVINNKSFPKFDYDNKIIFSFSDYEASKIVRMIEKQFLSGGFNAELKFPHLATKEAKNIVLNFSLYNNNIQCSVAVFVVNSKNKNSQIYLDENELEILKENLRSQYTLAFKDDMNFKKSIFEKV